VQRVLAEAFPTNVEAKLVEALRGATDPQISLVAEDDRGDVVGHVLFTPVAIRSSPVSSRAIGLGPMGVRPDAQRRGVGSALVKKGLAACRGIREPVVFVLGHRAYYPRFGFRPAWDLGLYYRVPGPNPHFMVLELEAGALRGRRGEVSYAPGFDAS
jgi:putative acetyltransferase